ncbi:transposase [Mediterraneibacter glycyrrhizinilyticus]|nr:transposase [Mediterraneibacter glycyrrhizinilyticus]
MILYGYSLTRSCSYAKKFLEDYNGYQGYNNLPEIRRCSCWIHYPRSIIILERRNGDLSLKSVSLSK